MRDILLMQHFQLSRVELLFVVLFIFLLDVGDEEKGGFPVD